MKQLDYEALKKNYTINYPEHFNFAFDVIDELAEKSRNKLALIWTNEDGDNRKITFWELKIYSNKIANFLQGEGINKGDAILVMLPRIPEWWFTMVGIMKIGGIIVPSAVSLRPRDIEYRCNKADIKMIITDRNNAGKVEEIRSNIPTVESLVVLNDHREGWINFEEHIETASRNYISFGEKRDTRITDPFLLYFTSGTTGYPKIVLHDHSYPLAHRSTAELWQDLKDNDIHWTITDTGWAKIAWGAIFGQWIMGATVFVYDYGRFKADKVLELIERFGVTTFCAPPTAYRMLILEDLKKYDFSELRHCVSAGEPLNPEVIEIWKRHVGLDIYEGFGQTESVVLVATLPGMKVKYGSMGKPSPLFSIEILDEDLKPVGIDQEGDIAVKVKPTHPNGLFKGYYADTELNAQVFQGDWYITGDRGYRDKEGYIWFVGRGDDIIKSSGYRIGPFEVESALIEHPAVVEAAVVGVPDKLKGQIVKAFVVLDSAHTPSEQLIRELQEHVKKVTAPFKYPKEIEFVQELPKTISGKIRRVELREREVNRGQKGMAA
ncbi:MAG: AMP-binding protein [bacterium]